MWRATSGCSGRRVLGGPCASELLSPVATASPGGWRSKAGSCMSRTSAPTRTTRCPRLWRPGDVPSLGVPLLRDGEPIGVITLSPAAGRAVHRAADRTGAHLCRSGGHRDRERAAARRIAGPHARPRRIARIPDRDQRRAQRHQPLDRRCATGAGHSGRNRRPALRRRFRNDLRYARARSTALCRVRTVQRSPSYWATLRQRTIVPGRDSRRPGGWRSKAGSCMSRTSSLTRTTRVPEAVASGRRTDAWGAAAARGGRARHDRSFPEAGRAVYRAADRAGAHLCRPGGHRDGECAAARRIAGAHARPRRIARIPDRDQRCA